ncbi:hypothetical protein OG2516_04933 [Oceanicola granulosus HTCC2516]|uniref:Uncharacterized protein n=1 Tax=Oceanicola granulosus (strain ATCC BAA-861 / DSM 15982 / KCTC 12143 / HTCC2516) TaxID=314256 RepID=Q2CC01_OCEGH|nr:hypothetical protein [Oceanicola granulosus]EAR50193.1 hypothetical protein OG2516_04933 [Oceanicola granulosus HTCC2516]
MFDDLKRRYRKHPRATTLFLLAAAVTLFFSARLLVGALFMPPPGPRPIEPWMTMRMVAHMHHLQARDIDELAGLPMPRPGRAPTLADHAAAQGVPVGLLIVEVEEAIAQLLAERDGQ